MVESFFTLQKSILAIRGGHDNCWPKMAKVPGNRAGTFIDRAPQTLETRYMCTYRTTRPRTPKPLVTAQESLDMSILLLVGDRTHLWAGDLLEAASFIVGPDAWSLRGDPAQALRPASPVGEKQRSR